MEDNECEIYSVDSKHIQLKLTTNIIRKAIMFHYRLK